MTPPAHRAAPPRPPAATVKTAAQDAERQRQLREREGAEGKSLLRGLLLLAVLVLVASVWRAGLGRAFVHGWWRQW